jgi:hypothetical protein
MKANVGDIVSGGMQFAILAVALFFFLSLTNETNAQVRRGFRGGLGYYGVFNRGIAHGSFFAPYIRARFTILPSIYLTYWIGSAPFYFYDGW